MNSKSPTRKELLDEFWKSHNLAQDERISLAVLKAKLEKARQNRQL